MLLNLGDPTATLAAIVTASVEEAATRAFLVEVDSLARRMKDLEQLHGDELELQQLMWYAIFPPIPPSHHLAALMGDYSHATAHPTNCETLHLQDVGRKPEHHRGIHRHRDVLGPLHRNGAAQARAVDWVS